jgi:hypothetical protein
LLNLILFCDQGEVTNKQAFNTIAYLILYLCRLVVGCERESHHHDYYSSFVLFLIIDDAMINKNDDDRGEAKELHRRARTGKKSE